MSEYFFFILHRGLSGVVNGLFYAASPWAWPILFVLAAFGLFVTIRSARKHWAGMSRWKRVLSVLGIIATLVSTFAVGFSFAPGLTLFSDIHLWTWLNQTSLSAQLYISSTRFFGKLWMLLLAISPSVALQKIMVNIFGHYGWALAATDDATGHTWSMKLFGRLVRVPRIASVRTKIFIGMAVLMLAVVLYYLYPEKIYA